MLVELSRRELSWAGAMGLACHPVLLFPICVLPFVGVGVVRSPLPTVVTVLLAMLVLLVAAAAIVRWRVAVRLSGDRVHIRNLWTSIEIPVEEVGQIENYHFWWSRGLWSLRLTLDDGRRIPIHLSATYRWRNLVQMRTSE